MSEQPERPPSMLNPRTKALLLDFIKQESKKAFEKGDFELMADLENARKLISDGCWTVRRPNPYILFMSECLKEQELNGSDLSQTQIAFRECSIKWKNLPKNEKEKYRKKAGELDVYDYL